MPFLACCTCVYKLTTQSTPPHPFNMPLLNGWLFQNCGRATASAPMHPRHSPFPKCILYIESFFLACKRRKAALKALKIFEIFSLLTLLNACGYAVANTVSGAAQPALLYLVPSLLFGVFIVAASRSEASLLLDYKEELTPVAVKNDDNLEWSMGRLASPYLIPLKDANRTLCGICFASYAQLSKQVEDIDSYNDAHCPLSSFKGYGVSLYHIADCRVLKRNFKRPSTCKPFNMLSICIFSLGAYGCHWQGFGLGSERVNLKSTDNRC